MDIFMVLLNGFIRFCGFALGHTSAAVAAASLLPWVVRWQPGAARQGLQPGGGAGSCSCSTLLPSKILRDIAPGISDRVSQTRLGSQTRGKALAISLAPPPQHPSPSPGPSPGPPPEAPGELPGAATPASLL